MTQPENVGVDTHLVEVYTAANEVDAGAIQAALDDAGIKSHLVGDIAAHTFGIPIGLNAPTIVVREEDAPAARQIIEQLQDQLSDDHGDSNARSSLADEEPSGDNGGE